MRWRKALAAVLIAGVGATAVADEAAPRPALPFTVAKETTVITSPLHEDGTPDYVGAMNERYGKGIKAEENAVVGWLKVAGTGERILPEKMKAKFLEMCGGKEEEGMKWVVYWEYLRDGGVEYNTIGNFVGEEIRARGRLWSEDDFPKLAEYLKSRKDYLDASKKAFEGGKQYWMPSIAGDGSTLNTVTFPVIGKVRETLGVIGERATLRMKGGDFDAFLADVTLIERLGRQMESAGSMAERLAGLTTDGMVSRMIGAAAGSGTLTQGQCVTLWKFLDGMDPPVPLEGVVDSCERWVILERAVLVATGKAEMLRREGEWFGGMRADTWNEIWTSMDADAVNWDAALKRINKLVDEKIAATKKASIQDLLQLEKSSPANSRTKGNTGKKDGESREEYTERVAQEFVEMGLAHLARPEITRRETEMQRNMARVMVALAAFRAEKGHWPEQLGELAPGFIKEIPRDLYSEGEKAEILYAKAESGVRVYSVGANGKDDGGVKDDSYLPGTGADDIAIGAGVDAK